MQEKIRAVQEEALRGSAAEERELSEKLQAAEQKKRELDAQKIELERMVEQRLQEQKQLENELRDYMNSCKQKRDERDREKRNIQDLTLQKKNRACTYGRQMPELIQAIQSNERRFKRKPIGPIGKFYQILTITNNNNNDNNYFIVIKD